MGNFGGAQNFSNKDIWKSISNTKHGNVIRNSKGEYAQVYRLRIPPQKLQKYLDIYKRRKDSPGYMIRVLDYSKSNGFVCDYEQSYSIVTERLIRLGQLPEMNWQQAIVVIKQVLILYQRFEKQFGNFMIRPQMIGKNSEGNIKIWMNQNLGENGISEQAVRSRDNNTKSVRRICRIISKKVIPKDNLSVKALFNEKKWDRYSISQAIQALSKIQMSRRKDNKYELKSQFSNLTFDQQRTDKRYDGNKSIYQDKLTQDIFNLAFLKRPFSQYVPSYASISSANPQTQPSYNYYPKFAISTQNKYSSNMQALFPSTSPHTTQLPMFQPLQKVQNTFSTFPSYSFTSELPHLSCLSSPIQVSYKSEISSTPYLSLTVNNTLFQNKLHSTEAPIVTQTDMTVKPSQGSEIHNMQKEVQRQMQEMRLIRSHVFVTSEDLYSNIDTILRNEKIKIQESDVVRRLSRKNSKVEQSKMKN